MAISVGSQVIETVSLSGGQKEWRKVVIDLPPVRSAVFCLRIFFALGGMGLRSCRLSIRPSEDAAAQNALGTASQE